MALYTALAKDSGALPSKTAAQVARLILARAKKYCPVDSGRLKDSGTVLNNLSHTQYGNASQVVFETPYAYIVHEDRTKQHKKGKMSKFLENAAIEVGLEFPYALTIEIRTDKIILYVNAPYKGAAISRSSADMQAHALTLTDKEQNAFAELDSLLGI